MWALGNLRAHLNYVLMCALPQRAAFQRPSREALTFRFLSKEFCISFHAPKERKFLRTG